jgi:hypothetical protein
MIPPAEQPSRERRRTPMRPRRRRRIWGLAFCLAAALLAIAWVRSHHRTDWITLGLSERHSIEIFSWYGTFAVQHAHGPHPPTTWLHFVPPIGRFGELRYPSWPARYVRATDNGATATGMVMWYGVPTLLLAALGAWELLRTRLKCARRLAARRANRPVCTRCGYDLRGTPAGRSCPECGQAARRRAG